MRPYPGEARRTHRAHRAQVIRPRLDHVAVLREALRLVVGRSHLVRSVPALSAISSAEGPLDGPSSRRRIDDVDRHDIAQEAREIREVSIETKHGRDRPLDGHGRFNRGVVEGNHRRIRRWIH
jgi:hypothetical protein